jgi:lipoyl(octanoyl) transferase
VAATAHPPDDGWRLVDDLGGSFTAAQHMAADVALLDDVVAGGAPVLRLYRWSPPALSLGRFQPDDDVDRDACARLGVDVVRRPSGGKALLHGGDLTYAVAVAKPSGPDGAVDAVYRRIAGALVTGLAGVGVEAHVARRGPAPGAACFAGQEGADLRVGTRKLCGSAQVQRDGAVLQHGSILLERLPFDETDLLRPGSRPERAALRAATVTLGELGAPTDPATVAAAVTRGFETTFHLRFGVEPTPAPPGGHRPEPEVDGSLAR